MPSIMPPIGRIVKKFLRFQSADNTQIAKTTIVAAEKYGVLYKLWVSVDVASEADLDNLNNKVIISVDIGAVDWKVDVHPLTTDTGATEIRHMDLGPWPFDFGIDGLYSGVKSDDIVITITAAGTNIKTTMNFIYAND